MADISVRKATDKDAQAILACLDAAHDFMAEHGNPTQWPRGYPDEREVNPDISSGEEYVAEDATGAFVGCFSCKAGPDPTYQRIDGAWLNDRPYHALHRIATLSHGRGIGTSCIRWCAERFGDLRCDTHEDNLPMQHALERCGFVRCGTIWTGDGTPRIAYQLVSPDEDDDPSSSPGPLPRG